MATDPVFGAELLEEGTAQAELILNEWWARLIASLVRVNSSGDETPPVTPVNFDAYILGATPTGAWSGQAGKIAFYVDGWKFMTPTEGMRVRVADTNTSIEYDGAAWGAGGGAGVQTLTDAATIAWDTALGRVAVVTLTAARIMGAPTNMVEGQIYTLHIIQDGVGSHQISSWNATVFRWPSGLAPVLTATASKKDIFQFESRGGNLYGSTVGLNYT